MMSSMERLPLAFSERGMGISWFMGDVGDCICAEVAMPSPLSLWSDCPPDPSVYCGVACGVLCSIRRRAISASAHICRPSLLLRISVSSVCHSSLSCCLRLCKSLDIMFLRDSMCWIMWVWRSVMSRASLSVIILV